MKKLLVLAAISFLGGAILMIDLGDININTTKVDQCGKYDSYEYLDCINKTG